MCFYCLVKFLSFLLGSLHNLHFQGRKEILAGMRTNFVINLAYCWLANGKMLSIPDLPKINRLFMHDIIAG